MTDRRKWKAEEKLAIIKDVKENGKVTGMDREQGN
jgi:transposase-like protein